MLRRYLLMYLLCLMNICMIIFVSLLFYGNRLKQNKPLPFLNPIPPLSEPEKSLFKSRLNHRLFSLGQQFSHINISKLLHIQSTSTQTLTYFCVKYCGGWGDRLRGITSTYMLAILLQRRFAIDMQYPCDLSHFLLPNLIDWTPTRHPNEHKNDLKLDPMHSEYGSEFHSNLSSSNLVEVWSNHDHIFLTTNGDYITTALRNPFFKLTKSQVNIQSKESTQHLLFPFFFELLFKPTAIVIDKVDRLFRQSSLHGNQSIICMHIRIGQNPTVPKDVKFPFRQSIVDDMVKFIDRNLSQPSASIFVTSDSYKIQEDLYKHYGDHRMLSISGPIVHIDRYDARMDSNETLYRGFLKVVADFYFLGECDTLLRPRSGFSEWASRRRLKEYSNAYMYCRGMYQITGPKWRRPYEVC